MLPSQRPGKSSSRYALLNKPTIQWHDKSLPPGVLRVSAAQPVAARFSSCTPAIRAGNLPRIVGGCVASVPRSPISRCRARGRSPIVVDSCLSRSRCSVFLAAAGLRSALAVLL